MKAVCALCVLLLVLYPVHRTARFRVPERGVDVYAPAVCARWTWPGTCTAPLHLAPVGTQGRLVRLWIMLDQGIRWGAGDAYLGLDAAYLEHLDSALDACARAGLVADLVVYAAAKGTADVHQFNTAALAGTRPALRAGYLRAVADLLAHLAATPLGRSVGVLDLFNEAYFQLERFGYSDDVIATWVGDLARSAKAAAPQFDVTVSDTGRLLRDPQTWEGRYPVDVYDIHVYDDTPWDHAALYRVGLGLDRPWFAGEAGCASGHVWCTYDGTVPCAQPRTCALSVDSWWVQHLPGDGARAVVIEDRSTVFSADSGALTLVGQMLAGG